MIFKDRIDAARKLAEKLSWLKKENPIILAIPRGGVVTGDVISSILGCNLDIIVSRKVGSPDNPELAIGAVLHDGSYFPNVEITRMLNVPESFIEDEIARQRMEIERRLMRFRGSKEYDLSGKTVVLVDDGIATGATMFVAAMWIRKQRPRKLIIAVPVGPKETIDKLDQIADEVIVLQSPYSFSAVGEFYEEFDQVSDEKVQEIMSKYSSNKK
ncbi:MAG: phosphoribosyltransferase [Thaumarchaeota archaeon]|nr:phosphoribosyltransferase [Nitrososphaerota archaeon]MDE1817345.1 phosphoribosyltransferase [Nitrososphaerota archaeon]